MQSSRNQPVGSNMLGTGYPFRMDRKTTTPQLQHGHGGAPKNRPTSITLAISGTDLAVENIEVPGQCKLDCEIGSGNNRTHFTPQPVSIPNDGRYYTIASTVSGSNTKHYTKLMLRGTGDDSENGIILDTAGCESMNLFCDDIPILPDDNHRLVVPKNTKIAKLAPVLVADRKVTIVCDDPSVEGYIGCDGQEYVLPGSSSGFEVPSNRGPLRLHVKAPPPAPAPAPMPTVETAPQAAPEISVRVGPENGESVVACHILSPGFAHALIEMDCGQHKASGHGNCILKLDPKLPHHANIHITSQPDGKTLLRQSIAVPQLESPPVQVRIEAGPGGAQHLFGPPGSSISVDGNPGAFPGPQGCVVSSSSVPQSICVKPQAGSETHISFKDDMANQFKWIQDLAAALDAPGRPDEEIAHAISQIRPQTKEGAGIVNKFTELFARPKPSMVVQQATHNTLSVSCPGFGLSVSHGSQPQLVLPAGGGAVQTQPGEPLTITALNQQTGSTAATCQVILGDGKPQGNPEDEAFLKALLDAFRNHPGNNKGIAADVQRIPPQGTIPPQLIPLIVAALDLPAPPSDTLVPLMLQIFRSAPTDNDSIAEQLGHLTPTTDTGKQFLPLVIQALKNSSLGSIPVLATDVPDTMQLFAAIDNATPSPILPTTGLHIPKAAQNVQLSARSSGGPAPDAAPSIVPEIVAIHNREPDAERRHAQWSQLVPQTPPERELMHILLDLSGRNIQRRLPNISFACGEGCIQNIRCDNYDLFVSIDGMPKMPLQQGSQVPKGTSFAEGSAHEVSLIACDRSGATVCSSTVTLGGGKPTSNGNGLSYVDLDLTMERQDALMRMKCPAAYRMSYTLDGIHSENIDSQLTARIDPQRGHKLIVKVMDQLGETVFQQQFNIPRFGNQGMVVGLQDNKLLLDHSPGIVTTCSINGSPERVVEDVAVQLSPDCPNRVVLKQFVGDASSTKIAEVALNLQQYIDPQDVKNLIGIYQCFDRNFPALTSNLMQLHATAKSALMRQLIGVLAARAHDNMQNDRWQEYFDSVIRTIKEMSFNAPSDRSYFFRLKGQA